jgi:hypothetical protein
MRRISAVVVGVLAAAALAGCSGDESPSSAAMSLDQVKAELVDAGIECGGKVLPGSADPDQLDLGVDVAKHFACTSGGSEIEASIFDSPADLTKALIVIETFACGFGVDDLTYVSEGKWMISATLPGDDGDTDTKLLAQIADALGTEVDAIDCPEGPSDESADDPTTSTTLLDSEDLVPADEAERDAADTAELGDEIDAGNGLFLTVSAAKVGGDDEPWIELEARAENRGTDTPSIPDFAVVCGGATEGEGWQADSTFPMYEEVRPGSFAEGTLNLLPTGNNRAGEPIEPCNSPAVIRITLDDSAVDLEVPDDVLAAYNTAAGN